MNVQEEEKKKKHPAVPTHTENLAETIAKKLSIGFLLPCNDHYPYPVGGLDAKNVIVEGDKKTSGDQVGGPKKQAIER